MSETSGETSESRNTNTYQCSTGIKVLTSIEGHGRGRYVGTQIHGYINFHHLDMSLIAHISLHVPRYHLYTCEYFTKIF